MDEEEYSAYCERARALLAGHLRARYGREAEAREPMTPYEAGIRTATFFGLPELLAHANTSFQTETLNARLDVLMHDLLRHPDDAPSSAWAQLYGYRSASAAGRAFRTRYGVGVGRTRLVGQLARWLANATRASRVDGRDDEALATIAAFTSSVQPRLLPLGALALRDLQTPGGVDHAGARPRFPRVAGMGRPS